MPTRCDWATTTKTTDVHPTDTPGAIATRRAAAYAETEPRWRNQRPERPSHHTAPAEPADVIAQRRAAALADVDAWERGRRGGAHSTREGD